MPRQLPSTNGDVGVAAARLSRGRGPLLQHHGTLSGGTRAAGAGPSLPEICERQLEAQSDEPRTAQERLFAATLALNSGAYDRVVSYLSPLCEQDPENDHVQYMLGIALALRGELEEALPHLRRAVELNPDNRAIARNDPDLERLRGIDGFRVALDSILLQPLGRRRPRSERSLGSPTDPRASKHAKFESSYTAGVPPTHVVILAAGKGTRMKSAVPKVMHRVAGLPMFEHVLRAARSLSPSTLTVVVGHQVEVLRGGLSNVQLAEQEPQLGTAHALLQAESLLEGHTGTLVLLSGDVPLLRKDTVRQLIEKHEASGAAATVLTAEVERPFGYGRIVRHRGRISRIVEERDASPAQKALREINTGIYAFDLAPLFAELKTIAAANAQQDTT